MRTKLFAANWKMNQTPEDTLAYAKNIIPLIPASLRSQVILCPPPALLSLLVECLGDSGIAVGAQNCHDQLSGAFTGETSVEIIRLLGAKYVIIGHSERRHVFGESDDFINSKVKTVQKEGLIPILCLGETLEQRNSGETKALITKQVTAGLEGVDFRAPLVLAYEPVWAIGTGEVAQPHQAEEAHQVLRETLFELGGKELSQNTSILYGGSVKPSNAHELSVQPNVDGFLIGGASLKPQSMASIVNIP